MRRANRLLASLFLAAGVWVAVPAFAAWNYQEEKDVATGTDIYTRAIDSVVTPSGDIFHLLVACEFQLNMYLILPTELDSQQPVKIRYQIDRHPAHDTVWKSNVPEGEKSKSLRVTQADWKIITSEAGPGSGEMTIDVAMPDEPMKSVTFEMHGYEQAASKVVHDCSSPAHRPLQPSITPASSN